MKHLLALIILIFCLISCKKKDLGTGNGSGCSKDPNNYSDDYTCFFKKVNGNWVTYDCVYNCDYSKADRAAIVSQEGGTGRYSESCSKCEEIRKTLQ